jgi:hypothetical protein
MVDVLAMFSKKNLLSNDHDDLTIFETKELIRRKQLSFILGGGN